MYIGMPVLRSLVSNRMTCYRGLFCYDWGDNTDHLYTRSTHPVFFLEFWVSYERIKHLAGHQFVIGRVVTGMYPVSLPSDRPQTNITRVREWLKYRDRTELASRVL